MSVRPFLVAAATALALASFAASAEAKPCRDVLGHFTACPVAKPAPAAQRCRSATGQFAACRSATVAPRARPQAAPTGRAAPTSARLPAGPVTYGAITARCRDGSMSRSAHRSGSCSSHGGVAAWM